MARRLLLNQEIITLTRGILYSGLPKQSAFKIVADRTNISTQVQSLWFRNGKDLAEWLEEDPTMKLNKQDKLYLEYYNMIETSGAVLEHTLVKRILNIADENNDAKPLMWFLERRFPKTYGKESTVISQRETGEQQGAVFNAALTVMLGNEPLNIKTELEDGTIVESLMPAPKPLMSQEESKRILLREYDKYNLEE